MSQIFEAIYEKGVLRPATPVVGLADGQRVWVTTDDSGDLATIKALAALQWEGCSLTKEEILSQVGKEKPLRLRHLPFQPI